MVNLKKNLTFQAPSPLFGEPRQAPECLLHLLWRTGAGERDLLRPQKKGGFTKQKSGGLTGFNQKRGKPLMI